MVPQGTVKTHFFFPQEKETVFGIQRKRGSQRGQVAPNRVSAARLSVPIEVRPRPQWTTWAEQGQAVVLSHLFSPPAWAGDAAWFGAPSRRAPQIAWRHIGTTGGSYPPESLPLGEGAPVRTLGRMRGSLAAWLTSPSGCSLPWGATTSARLIKPSPSQGEGGICGANDG